MTFLSKTLGVAGQALTGTADDNTQLFRTGTCYACPTLIDTAGVGFTCGKYLNPEKGVSCGCVIENKKKVLGAKCPQGKW